MQIKKSSVMMIFALSGFMFLNGCGSSSKEGSSSPNNCLSAECHGDVNLRKTIVKVDGTREFIPLYVDRAQYAASVHKDQKCEACHTDINASGGAHGPVAKTYGGWARLGDKQAVETISTNEIPRTRNYYTAASRSCVTCHSNHPDFANSAHVTIFKHRNARIDPALRSAAQAAFPLDTIGTLGEDYVAGDCNRCHTSCATCHFKSTIKRLTAGNPIDFWNGNQTAYPTAGWNDKMTEFEMDWTTNVASHDFRRGSYFKAEKDPEGVCEACHTGFYKPAKDSYYWADAAKTVVKKVKATEIKRHPQLYELMISGMNSPVLTGGSSPHAGFACADCHVGLHSLPGLPYEWDDEVGGGDVKCITCHAVPHGLSALKAAIDLHHDGTGTDVACVGCHAFGMGRDFDIANGVLAPTSSDVFLDPETNQVRPVARKQGVAVPWYPHNWQTLNPAVDCANKCHYSGNPLGVNVH